MRKAFLAMAAVAILAASGCHYNLARNGRSGCSDCGGGQASCGHAGCGHSGGGLVGGPGGAGFVPRLPHGAVHDMNNPANGGPPSATTAYPYYAVKAPRDFLAPNPPSIGY